MPWSKTGVAIKSWLFKKLSLFCILLGWFGARGTLVATDQSTPAQSGAYGGADQLIGTDARKAKQAQRREAREAKQRTLLAATPLLASSKSAIGSAAAAIYPS